MGDGVDEEYRHQLIEWRRRLDMAAAVMFRDHPDLDVDQDSVVLNSEDIRELFWLDCEIGIEHVAGRHRNGCPIGCLFRER